MDPLTVLAWSVGVIAFVSLLPVLFWLAVVIFGSLYFLVLVVAEYVIAGYRSVLKVVGRKKANG